MPIEHVIRYLEEVKMGSSTDEIVTKIAINFITEIFKSAYQTLAEAERWLASKRQEHDLFGAAARRYTSKLEQQHSMTRILGMDRPISLRSIYVDVNILEKITARQRITIETLEHWFDRDQRSFGTAVETVPGIRAVETLERFIVLGKPGAGKTTFLKNIMFQTLDGKIAKSRLPIFVSLKDLADSNKSLLDFVVDEFEICNFPSAGPFIRRILAQGRCQLLLDGLDEVPANKQDFVIKEILALARRYDGNQIVISCRTAAYNQWFASFTDVEMADFNDEQIRQFVQNWFSEEPRIGEECWKRIFSDAPIKELATVPLLLTLLCLAFNETMGFPNNRADLYKEAIDALLKKWDSARRIRRSEVYKNLSLKRKESLFCRIAKETFEHGNYFISQRTLERYIADFIQHLPEANQATLEPDSEAVLVAIEANHGIFVQRASGIYSFSHLTFQEYFTGQYIVEHSNEESLEEFVNEHLDDSRWQEVFLLISGMLENADTYLLQMKRKIDRIATEGGLIPLFDKVSELIGIERRIPYPYAIARGIAIYNATIREDKGEISRRRLRLARSLLRELERALSPELAAQLTTSDSDRSVLSSLRRALRRAHSDPREIPFGINLDVRLEAYDLETYLNLYLLLFGCLRSGCYVSRPVREQLVKETYSVG